MDESNPSGIFRRIGLKDIARELRVSVTTVSRALRDDTGIGKDTRNKVHEASRRLGYVPNLAGAALSTGKTNAILVIVPYSLSGFPRLFHMEVLEGVVEEVARYGYKVDIVLEKSLRERRQDVLDAVDQAHADGAVLVLNRSNAPELEDHDFRIPVVLVNFASPKIHADAVMADDERGAYLATKMLIEAGHTHIAHVAGSSKFYSNMLRRRGYQSAIAEQGLADQKGLLEVGVLTKEGGFTAVKRLLAKGAAFTGVFCCRDVMAIGAIEALQEVGLSVPQDVSVVGFDDDVFAPLIRPALTTVHKPRYLMGRTAGRILIRRLRGKVSARRSIVTVRTRLIQRETVSPVPRPTSQRKYENG
jgi:DNA-binding LacI/PurR family transcriptional regulator